MAYVGQCACQHTLQHARLTGMCFSTIKVSLMRNSALCHRNWLKSSHLSHPNHVQGWEPRVIWIAVGGCVFFTALEAAKKLYAPKAAHPK